MSSRWPQSQQDERPGHPAYDEAWSSGDEGAQPWQDAGWQDAGWGDSPSQQWSSPPGPPAAPADPPQRAAGRGERSRNGSPGRDQGDQFDQEWNQSGGGFGDDEDYEWFQYLGVRGAKPDDGPPPAAARPGRDRSRDSGAGGRTGRFRSRRDKTAADDPGHGHGEPADHGRGGHPEPAERTRGRSARARDHDVPPGPEWGHDERAGHDRGPADPGPGQAAALSGWPEAPARRAPADPGFGHADASPGWPAEPAHDAGYGPGAADPGLSWPGAPSTGQDDAGYGYPAADPGAGAPDPGRDPHWPAAPSPAGSGPGARSKTDQGFSWPAAPSYAGPADDAPVSAAPAPGFDRAGSPSHSDATDPGPGPADEGFHWPAAPSHHEPAGYGTGHGYDWPGPPSRPDPADPGAGPAAPGFDWPAAPSHRSGPSGAEPDGPGSTWSPSPESTDPGLGHDVAEPRSHRRSDAGTGQAAPDGGPGRAESGVRRKTPRRSRELAAADQDAAAPGAPDAGFGYASDPEPSAPGRGRRSRHGRPDPGEGPGHAAYESPPGTAAWPGTSPWPGAPGSGGDAGFRAGAGDPHEAPGWPQAPVQAEPVGWPGPPEPARPEHDARAVAMGAAAPAFAEPQTPGWTHDAPAWSDPSGWPGAPEPAGSGAMMNAAPVFAEPQAPGWAQEAPAWSDPSGWPEAPAAGGSGHELSGAAMSATAFADPEAAPGWPEAPAWPEPPGPGGEFSPPGPGHAGPDSPAWTDAPGWPDTSSWSRPAGTGTSGWPEMPGADEDAPGWPVAADPEGAPGSTDPHLARLASAAPGGERENRPPTRRGDRGPDAAGPGRGKTRDARSRPAPDVDGQHPGGPDGPDGPGATQTAPAKRKGRKPAGPKAPAQKKPSAKTARKQAPGDEGLRLQAPAAEAAAPARSPGGKLPRPSVKVIGIVGASAAVLAGAAVVVLSQSGGSVPHVLTTPAQIGAYVQEPQLAQQMHASALQQQLISEGGGELTNVRYQVYEDSTGPGASSSPQIVLFLGGNLSGVSPGSFISAFIGKLEGAETTSPGTQGGSAACVPSMDGRLAECVWADNDTFGVVASQTLTSSALASELRQVRAAVEHPASGQQ